MNERGVEKIEKYKALKYEIARMWGMKEVIVISVIVGALRAISTGFEKYIAAIGIEMRAEHAHKKSALLEAASILRVVLGCLKKSIIICIVQDPVRTFTTGCCLLS